MNEKLSAAIDVLLDELKQQQQQVAETKRMINALRQRTGQEPLFPDAAVEQLGVGPLRPDQYYGKPLATAAQEYLERRKQACAADEILKGLEQGSFDFDALGWKENRVRSLAMSLAKNTKAFHRLPNGFFGLVSWYDEKTIRRKGQDVEKESAAESTTTEGPQAVPRTAKESKKASA
jgi:hypothetical protein